ncbi:hypothetical protein AX17_002509 [Amanita inopinata Kibby_2008]|nr:hypothetical protein AX17_002509 [Amanita inopinata Kibby_2008]
MNAALIEARDNERRAKLIAEGTAAIAEARKRGLQQAAQEGERPLQSQPQTTPSYHEVQIESDQPGPTQLQQEQLAPETSLPKNEEHGNQSSRPHSTEESSESPWVEHTPETLKPQAWTPTSRSRGK